MSQTPNPSFKVASKIQQFLSSFKGI
uniref:Uncharacterized protein n=1 Tax=Anguilla anguilla TaxID=7936 RepID=A0A0E9QNQ1_ANGAN